VASGASFVFRRPFGSKVCHRHVGVRVADFERRDFALAAAVAHGALEGRPGVHLDVRGAVDRGDFAIGLLLDVLFERGLGLGAVDDRFAATGAGAAGERDERQ